MEENLEENSSELEQSPQILAIEPGQEIVRINY